MWGASSITMAQLRALAEDAGLGPVESVLQSGNFIVEGGAEADNTVRIRLQQALKEGAGLACDLFVLGADAFTDLLAQNPMPDEAEAHPSAFLVMLLEQEPRGEQLEKFEALCRNGERLKVRGATLYAVFPAGMGRSRLASTLSVGKIVRGTGRNWNAMRRLAGVLSGGTCC
ncbi:MAG: DUF1697 domain-containing protein [Xanthobacter sp.]